MSALAVSAEGVDRDHCLLRRDCHNLGPGQREEPVKSLASGLSLATLDNAGSLNARDGRHQAGGRALNGLGIPKLVVFLEEDRHHSGRINVHQRHMPESS